MVSWEIMLYAFLCGVMMMVSALGLESAIVSPSLDRWSKRFFTVFFTVLVLNSVTYFFELIIYVYPALADLVMAAYYIESLLCVFPFPMLAVYLLHCTGEDIWKSPLFYATAVLWTVYFAVVNISLFTDYFYSVATDYEEVRGPGYVLVIMIVLAMLLLVAVGLIRRRDKLSRQYRHAFVVCLLPVAIAVVIHVFVSVFQLVGLGLAISAYAMHRIIESYALEQNLRQQQEIANQRASIAVLQMRPHFIYNTMTSIYYLCDQDSKLAQQVTLDFTTYLRKNFTAIVSSDTIPFSEELEHTRAYLAVEQAQFEGGLFVDYDTPHTQFHVPPLTLQPLVENAVKHGMDPDSDPLHICVRTRKTDSGSEIVVEDNGSGFEPADDGKPHIAIGNIEERLEMMCGGRLTIMPREDGGTVAKVTIPQRG